MVSDRERLRIPKAERREQIDAKMKYEMLLNAERTENVCVGVVAVDAEDHKRGVSRAI